jgi:hypothetical protein
MNHKRRAFSSESQPHRTVPPHLERSPGSRSAQANRPVAERIRAILATRNLTLYDVSRQTLALFPENPHYHIPHNFYFQIDSAGLSPTLHQMSALSLLSRYRFVDWLAVFGFSLDEIPRLEAALPSRRTAFLDNNVYDVAAKTSWFRERSHEAALPPFGPLSRLLEPAGPRRLSLLMEMNRKASVCKLAGRILLPFQNYSPVASFGPIPNPSNDFSQNPTAKSPNISFWWNTPRACAAAVCI